MTPYADPVAPTARAQSQTRVLASLSRRLDREALVQLRSVAATQAVLIEQLQAQVSDLQASLQHAEACADWWREDALDAIERLADERGEHVGLTQAGQLVLMPAAAQVSA